MVSVPHLASSGSASHTASVLLLYREPDTAAGAFRRLSSLGYGVVLCPAANAIEGWQEQLSSDLVIVLDEFANDGLIEICCALRDRTNRPIIVLAECCEEQLIARTLDAGVDEYLPASIGDRELSARIDALLRRFGGHVQDVWHVGGLTLSMAELSAEVFGRRVFLTPIEFRLIACLASAPGKVFTHETLMSRVWGAEYVDARHYLYLYVRYLREKLEPDPKRPRFIVSEWGVGYRLQPVEHASP